MSMEQGTLHYVEWNDLFKVEKPFQILIDLPETISDRRLTNVTFHSRDEVVEDVRGKTDKLTLDTHGFMFVSHKSQLGGDDFFNREIVESRYLAECESVIRMNVEGVDQVHFFNWLVRDTDMASREGRGLIGVIR